MVTISKPLNSGQAQSYHKLEFTSESQNYWKRGDTVQGDWQGRLAAKMGLTGEVSAEHFARLADGQNPKTGEQMVQHRDAQEYKNADGTTTKPVEHRAGWDATFSAPKSVSLTALVGGDDRVREAHRNAVTTALSDLERYTQARIGGNNPAETTGQFIAAKFEHDTARPVDGYAASQLHTHAVIFNVTHRADGSTRALQERGLFETQNFATAVYQSELTYQLRNLGYEIEPGRSGAPEIKGYSQEYLDASSPRSQQIKEHLEKMGYNSPAAAQIAAHSTRDGKKILTPEQVLKAHKEIAAAFGNQAERIVAEARERAQTQERKSEVIVRAREAVAYAKESIFEREAVADERKIMRDALRRGMGETPYASVRAEFDNRQNRGEFRQIDGQKHDTGRSFTTPETIAAERANIEHMRAGKNTVEPMMTPEKATAHTQTRDFLNPAQRAVIEEILTSRDRIHGLQGLAGTGKTTALETIKEGAERGGYAVEGFAPTSKATGQLGEAGISADTLQGFLARGGQERTAGDPNNRHLYLLDESSLASTRQMQSFLEKIGPQDRVLVIGDIRQHQGVDAGRPFEQMQDAGMRTAQLDQIVRQKDPGLLKVVEHLSKNDTATGIKLLREQGRVTEIADPKQRIESIAKDYAAKPENAIIVSPDNRTRQEINQAVRVELQASGALAKDGREFTTLVQRSNMTGADRGWAARYQVGDVLQYTRGSKAEGIARGTFATVLSANARENTVTVRRNDGQSVTYNPARLKGVNAYRETACEIAPRDRIQFTAPDRKLGVANRDLGTVQSVEGDRIIVAMDDKTKRIVSFDPTKMRQFDHGYAVTSHSSQGLTAGRVLANIDTEAPGGLINSRLAYVAISRASEDARIYTNDAGALGTRLATEISKTAAVDFRPASSAAELRQVNDVLGGNETGKGVEMLQKQLRIREYADPNHRLAAVAIDYAAQPGRTIVVAPDPADRQELTSLIRDELRRTGALAGESRFVPVLIEQTGSRQSAATYAPGDTIQYRAGSRIEGIAANSLATVVAVEAERNILTIQKTDGEQLSYSPHQLKEVTMQSTVYRVEHREIAIGERIQITVAHKEQGIRARDFGTVERVAENNALTVRMDSGKTVELDPHRARHIEYGYVVDGTKAVSTDRVLVTLENAAQLTGDSALGTAISRASREVSIYTSDGSALARPAPPVEQQQASSDQRHEQAIEQQQPAESARIEPSERVYTWAEHERHYAPLNNALTPVEADQFAWRAETGTIQSYQHNETNRCLYIDGPTGQFYDQDRNPISQDAALDHAMPAGHVHSHQDSPTQNSIGPALSQSQPPNDNSQGLGL